MFVPALAMSALAAISVASAKGAYRFILLAVEMQCALSVTLSQCLEARMRSKVSGCKIPFPRLLFAACPPRPISNGLWGSNLDTLAGSDGIDQLVAGRQTSKGGPFLTPGGRPESERAPLIRPCHRQVDETLETKAGSSADERHMRRNAGHPTSCRRPENFFARRNNSPAIGVSPT